ncbi:hypothetical protein BX666DRAFT_2034025 [Dichotomocladium elegans]|nr:hypothetical protein BX666DRAFT_2034025 [Dichotomocladium elegans]
MFCDNVVFWCLTYWLSGGANSADIKAYISLLHVFFGGLIKNTQFKVSYIASWIYHADGDVQFTKDMIKKKKQCRIHDYFSYLTAVSLDYTGHQHFVSLFERRYHNYSCTIQIHNLYPGPVSGRSYNHKGK